jgi:S-DNA-T family DNA segregation ATPase FtsK/SpoIIIE
VQRLIDRLRTELRSRSASDDSRILLVIDDWEGTSGPLDGLDYGASAAVLADLAGRGPSCGITVVVTGDLRMQHHRSSSAFTTVIRLGVDQRGEAVAAPPGRGRLEQDEIQMAHCPPDAPPPRGIGGHRAPVVRVLPGTIGAVALPTAGIDAVPLGIGGDDGSPQTVDLGGPGGGFLIAGPRRAGVSTALELLAINARAAGLTVIRAVVKNIVKLPGVRDVDLRHAADELRQQLVEHEGPLLLIADDIGNDQWPDDATALLERFVTVAGPGQYLAIGTRLDRASRAHRGLIAEVAAFRSGLLLQPDSSDGGLLDIVLPRRRGQLPPGRGYLVQQGRATPLQVALP